jgi:ABC-type lipoprotein export system ATPase subunit
MSRFEHIVQTKYIPTFRTRKVEGMFDVPVSDNLVRKWAFDIPLNEKPWQVGLIVGASGSGKTTLARSFFAEDAYHSGFSWSASSLLDDFDEDKSVREITDALSHVGFSSPPAWLLPYRVLSNGQKFRAEIARLLLSEKQIVVFDEFTSVVDRTVAKAASVATAKFARKRNQQFVAVTCHDDVEPWLQPDWVVNMNDCTFKWGCLRQPRLRVEINQVSIKAWELFKHHHYLSATLHKASACYMASIDGSPAAFCSVLHFPHAKEKKFKREHRTVVLPDFQGLGLGNLLSENIGRHYLSLGFRFISTTSHPAMIHYRAKSKNWRITNKIGHNGKTGKTGSFWKTTSTRRLTASFELIK